MVMAAIGRTGIKPQRLKLELTESLLADNLDEQAEDFFLVLSNVSGATLADDRGEVGRVVVRTPDGGNALAHGPPQRGDAREMPARAGREVVVHDDGVGAAAQQVHRTTEEQARKWLVVNPGERNALGSPPGYLLALEARQPGLFPLAQGRAGLRALPD